MAVNRSGVRVTVYLPDELRERARVEAAEPVAAAA